MDITARLLHWVQAKPTALAITDDQRTLTYGELAGAALSAAHDISRLTDRPYVGIGLPTCVAFPCSFFGIVAAGKAAMPINFLFTPELLAYAVRDSGIDTIITSRQFQKMFEGLVPKLVFVEDATPRKVDFTPPKAAPDDPAMLVYTSGTSADPKGVILTHKNLIRNVESAAERYDYGEGDVTLGVLPLFHVFASTCTMLLPLLRGGRAVYQARFLPQKFLAAVPAHRITTVFAVPAMYRMVLRTPDAGQTDMSSVKYCVSGGEALGEGIARQFQQTFGKPLLEGYGMTEASPVVAINPIDAPVPGSVGLPLDWAEVKLMADDDREATIWAEGEIWLRGDCVMKGYHNNPAATAATITPDGWLRTGDIGRIDAKGYLFITGRKKELIISGGENISPVEVENVIAGHPAVAEVGVVAMPDESRGEVPKAYIVLRPDAKCTEKDILDYCRERLPRVKQPRVVQFLKEMPRSPAGKILRRLLGK